MGLGREVRMLTQLGFSIPTKIQQTTDLAKKFAAQAKALDQIASFHNTIGDRMITSQVIKILTRPQQFSLNRSVKLLNIKSFFIASNDA